MKYRIVTRGVVFIVQYKSPLSPMWHTFKSFDVPREFETFEKAKAFLMEQVKARKGREEV